MHSHVVPGLGSQAVPRWFPGSAREVPGLISQGGCLRGFPGGSQAVAGRFPGRSCGSSRVPFPVSVGQCSPSGHSGAAAPLPLTFPARPHRVRSWERLCVGSAAPAPALRCRAAGQQEHRDTNSMFQRGSVLVLHCSLTKCCTESFAAPHLLSKHHIHET